MSTENLCRSNEMLSKIDETKKVFSHSGIIEYLESIRDQEIVSMCRSKDLSARKECVKAFLEYNIDTLKLTYDSSMKLVEKGTSLHIYQPSKKINITKLENGFKTLYENDYCEGENGTLLKTVKTSGEVIEFIRQVIESNRQGLF